MTYLFNCSAIYKCKDSYDFVGGDMPIGSIESILEGRIIRISRRRKDNSNDDHGGEDVCLQSC